MVGYYYRWRTEDTELRECPCRHNYRSQGEEVREEKR